MSERPMSFVLDTREQLLNALAEAAEIEHNLMCCYLYAAFSLKQGLDEDLTERELSAVERWRSELIHVAIGEMTHLALVANLMSAIGGVPHFRRANLPVPPGYHPAAIVVKLAPFNRETLEHFIYLERPEEARIRDGSGFEPSRGYRRVTSAARLAATNADYETVGALYRAIDQGLHCYAELHGEAALFVGNPEQQLGPDASNLPGLVRVQCLDTARAALDRIVVDGEGSNGGSLHSHFHRFTMIRRELIALQSERVGFVPARPAAESPVMRAPATPENRVWITASPAAELLDVVNTVYVHMLRLLVQAYAENRGLRFQREMATAAAELMFAITPVASALTRLPARVGQPTPTAGMSFAVPQQSAALPVGASADRVLVERLDEIVVRTITLSRESPWLTPVVQRLARTRERLYSTLGQADDAARLTASAEEREAVPVPSPQRSERSDRSESVPGKLLTTTTRTSVASMRATASSSNR